MKGIIEFLSGKKTYIVAILVALVVGLRLAGIIDQGTAEFLIGVLGAGGLITIRAAITKSGPPAPTP